MQYADRTKLRAYFFGNMYLSPIQQGIQCSHVVTKMFANYPYSNNQLDGEVWPCEVLYQWANDGVTKILLNGGYQSNLANVYSILEIVCPKLGLPYAKFHEEEASLNGALTSVGVVVPEEVYGLVPGEDDYMRYYEKHIGNPRALGQAPLHHARIAVLEATSTPLDILKNINLFKFSYEERDWALALRLTLNTARLA